MNIEALKRTKQELEDRSKGSPFLTASKINGEMIVRLLPEPAILNGMFHWEVIKWWIAGKAIIDQATFGKKSVIQEEIDAAKASDDADLVALATNNDSKTGASRKPEMWMALLQLEYKLNKSEEVVGVTVVEDKAKIFTCGPQLLTDMIKAMTSRAVVQAAKGSTDYGADRVKGSNLLLSKTGSGKMGTKYAATADEIGTLEMDAKYYNDIPNVYEYAKQQCSFASYQRAVIRQYLYGEEIPADVQAKEDARAEAAKQEAKAAHAAAPVAAPAAKKKAVIEEAEEVEEEDAPVPAKKAAKKTVADEDEDDAPLPVKKAAKKAAVEEDEDDAPLPVKKVAAKKSSILDDDDDEDAPVPVKKAATKKAVLDDDDDEPPAAKKKSAAPPPAAKKAGKSILDDIDDDLEE